MVSLHVDYTNVSRTLAQAFDAAANKVRDAIDEGRTGADLQLVAADPELLNVVLTALQLMISLIVRLNNPNQQGDHFDGIKAGILKRAFDIIHLRFFNPNPSPHAKEVAEALRRDVRVLFFISLLLRDVTQLNLKRESWLWFSRRPIFLAMLTDTARATVRIFENVFIAMRSLLLASCHKPRMKPPDDEAFYIPEGSLYPHWDWRAQDVVKL